MQYFVILTKECNLFCTYCGGGSDTPPKEVQYSVADLTSFLSSDGSPAIEFYGGEPLLRIGAMKEIVDAVPVRFMLQTNGIFLDRIDPQHLARFHSILVSVDGPEEITDGERGNGVYERVTRNLGSIRQRGFRGDLVARMTVVQGADVHGNVHWQLSFSMFWEAGERTEPGLAEWIAEYNSGISSLVDWWVDEMSRSKRIPGIVPFIGVTNSLLTGRDSGLRCGSGSDSFSIMPDGRVSACPVSVDFDFSVIGSIFGKTPRSLCGVVEMGEPCVSCDVFRICGGRCLFVNKSQGLLRKDGYYDICKTVKHLVTELQDALPRVRALIESGSIRASDFEYPEFNNGCEIIP